MGRFDRILKGTDHEDRTTFRRLFSMTDGRGVTVVIPTHGRDTLEQAVDSALSQTLPPSEVIVAINGAENEAEALRSRLPAAVRVVATGASANANTARNLGGTMGSGAYVAFLDDDDYWHPDKLREQVRAAESARALSDYSSAPVLVACAYRVIGQFDGEIWPHRGPSALESPGDYLFVRTGLSRKPTGFQTSTILVSRDFLINNPFDESREVHQDWDWFIRSVHHSNPEIVFLSRALSVYRFGTSSSASRRTNWRQSLMWATDPSLPLSPRARGDFLLTVGLTRAAEQGGIRAVATMVLATARVGRPGLWALSLAVPRVFRGLARRRRVI